jgi:hypothetical protein
MILPYGNHHNRHSASLIQHVPNTAVPISQLIGVAGCWVFHAYRSPDSWTVSGRITIVSRFPRHISSISTHRTK